MTARHVGRRAIAGSGLAALVLAAAAAGSAKAAELDGELLAAVTEHLRLQEESLADFRTSDDDKAFMERDMPRFDRMDELYVRIEHLRPSTPEGLAAKAQLVARLIKEQHELDGKIPEEAPRLAYSLCMDLIGRAG